MPDDTPCTCGCPNTFSTRDAEADLKRYRNQGPDRTTRSLIDAITPRGIEGATLLDIGGGIGVVALELLAAGAARVTSVDATAAYVAVANAEAERRGFGGRASARVGDFVQLAQQIDQADVVTLDRVLCCYPDLNALLGQAAAHARRMVGLVYPRETWWNGLARRVLDAASWVRRDPSRWYVHRTRDVDTLMRAKGFERHDVDRTLVWQVALYVREPAAGG
jgi:magnesium-protoporphyrin O-methyltransferase